ncbi:TonB-dependent receptor, partial [Avibacterium paragallinarum]|uniref:TonB-dependent receptor n=1 Tax=Avibacterium paragallinarum TaxID=728 RepID=UPI003986BC4C
TTHGGRARVQDIQNLTYALPTAPEGSINLIPAWSGQTTRDQTLMLTTSYDFPYELTLSGGIGHMLSRYYGNFGQILATDITPNGDYKISQMRAIDYITRTTSGNLKLQGNHFIGNVSHNWNLALDAVVRERDFDQSPIIKKFSGGNIYHPNFAPTEDFKPLAQGSTDQKIKSYSVAIADTLGFFDDQFRLTLGGRLQWIRQINYKTENSGSKHIDKDAKAHRFSPMLTLAWVQNPNLVVYGNYLEDLEPGYVDEEGTMAPPRVSRQIEIGTRKNWGEYLTTTLSLYQISRPGMISPKSATKYHRTSGEEQGKERNRGIEFNLYANLLEGHLRPNLGITYNKGELINYSNYSGEMINGSQVASPRIISKAGIEWEPTFAPNLLLNASIQYYGKSYQKYDKSFKFPTYTTVDLGAKYQFKLNETQSLILRTGIENLFNKHYWQVQRGKYDRSFALVGMPRTYWAKIEYSF